jgi:hypothetical protein
MAEPTTREIAEAWAADGGLPDDLALCSAAELAKLCWACWRRNRVTDRAHIQARSASGDNNDPLNYLLLCPECHKEQPDGAPKAEQLRWLVESPTQIDRLLGDIQRNADMAMRVHGVSVEQMTAVLTEHRAAVFREVQSARMDRSTLAANLVWATCRVAASPGDFLPSSWQEELLDFMEGY